MHTSLDDLSLVLGEVALFRGLSPAVIANIIRGRIGFDGLLMSDDLGMHALKGDFGVRAIYSGADMTKGDQIAAMIHDAEKALGSVDVLVNNAGIQTVEPLDQFEFAKWKKLLSIHLDGAFLTTRAALRQMYAHGRGGSIIYMGSVHSKEASVLKAPYVTAKHGLIGLAKVVAKEGAKHGVRANVICPGFVRTPLVEKQIPEQAKELRLRILPRLRLEAPQAKAPRSPQGVTIIVAASSCGRDAAPGP